MKSKWDYFSAEQQVFLKALFEKLTLLENFGLHKGFCDSFDSDY